MSPLYCLLFVIAFLGSLQTISADPLSAETQKTLDDIRAQIEAKKAELARRPPVIPNPLVNPFERFVFLYPNDDQVLAAFNATTPAILDLINEKYPDAYGAVRPPFAAQQVKATNEYRITFQVVQIRVTKDLREDPNFTAFIDEITDPEEGVKYKLNDVVQNPPLH